MKICRDSRSKRVRWRCFGSSGNNGKVRGCRYRLSLWRFHFAGQCKEYFRAAICRGFGFLEEVLNRYLRLGMRRFEGATAK